MSKWAMSHRVVVRDEDGKIVKETPCEHFAEGKPIYDAAVKDLPEGHSVCLQAGIRVMLRYPKD